MFSDVLLAVDFDRTLTAQDATVPARNVEAIRYFMENGGAFTVNTGRSAAMFKRIMPEVGANVPYLLWGGSAAYDHRTGEVTDVNVIDLDLDATMEQVVAAAKAAHIHSYISRLPEGYGTILSDNGTSISKGQKQLLTIARAMLLDAHMLILDEATSNVDTRTEQQIQAAMRTLMKGKTCFVIAHRLSTIQSADHILVLDGGKVVEQGTHEELMARNGFYKKLYQAQFDAVS